MSALDYSNEDDEGPLSELADGWNYYEFSIASDLLPALINGDVTGLDDDDEAEFDQWLASIPKVVGHWAYDEVDDCGFSTCAVSGLLSDCTTVKLMFKEPS